MGQIKNIKLHIVTDIKDKHTHNTHRSVVSATTLLREDAGAVAVGISVWVLRCTCHWTPLVQHMYGRIPEKDTTSREEPTRPQVCGLLLRFLCNEHRRRGHEDVEVRGEGCCGS